jgi:ribose/xylose/arabinose/galactoside ABC-type transport system permease subunit
MSAVALRRGSFPAQLSSLPVPLAALIPVLAAAAFIAPAFYDPSNLGNLSEQIAVLGLVTAGQFLVLLVGGLDLSVGALMGVTAVILTRPSADTVPGFAGLLLAALAAGVVVGLINGVLVVKRRVPAFIVTLGMFVLLGGARLAYTGGSFSGTVPSPVRGLGLAYIGPVPVAVLFLVAIYLVLAYVLYFTPYGRGMYATGTNREAAWLSGVPTDRLIIASFVLCSVLTVLAGWALTAYVGYVDQNLGAGTELDSIAAALIGGASFIGGQGRLIGVLTGALLVSILVNLVVVLGLDIQWQEIVKALVVLVAVASGALLRRHSRA